jgi:hypothetical protein
MNKLPYFEKMMGHLFKSLGVPQSIYKEQQQGTVKEIVSFLEYALGHNKEFMVCLRQYVAPMINHMYVAEKEFTRTGRNHIIVSREVFDIIQTVNLDGVDVQHVKQPYDVVCWKGTFLGNDTVDTPFGFLSQISKRRPASKGWDVLENCVAVGCVNTLKGKPPSFTDFQYAGSALSDIKTLCVDTQKQSEEYLGSLVEGTVERLALGSVYMEFVLRACVFIQAHPECLKKDVNSILIPQGKNKRQRKNKRNTPPSFVLEVPSIYRASISAHFVAPHFRSLEHPRFGRLSPDGEVLPPGVPGQVRIVPVKGFSRGGKFHHVDKEEAVKASKKPLTPNTSGV